MLKRDITYTDFNDNQVTETFYFNVSKSELVELEYSYKEGFGEALQRIIKTEDKGEIIATFKKLVLIAYGEKSEDGKKFIKNDELRAEFVQSAAYDALFMELAVDDKKAAEFIQGVLPKDLSAEVTAAMPQQRPPVSMTPFSTPAPLIPPVSPT